MKKRLTLSVKQAASCLKKGNVIAIPTETVYGLFGNALDQNAIQNIFRIKKRPKNNPVIVHLPCYKSIFQYAIKCDISESLSAFWPGPLSIVMRHNNKISTVVTADSSLCAFRIPDHPLALEILSLSNLPLAAPSANTSKKRSPTTIQMIESEIIDQIGGVVDGGPCRIGIESTVVEIIPKKGVVIHRPGNITKEQILKKGVPVLEKKTNIQNKIKSPGQMMTHYAPDKPLILVNAINQDAVTLKSLLLKEKFQNVSIISFGDVVPLLPDGFETLESFQLSSTSDCNEAAKNLYLSFDKLSQKKCDAIVCCLFQKKDMSQALNDRLVRASTFRIF